MIDSPPIRFVIIGAGSIGAFQSGVSGLLNHDAAICANNDSYLESFCDIDIEKAALAGKMWNCASTSCIDEALGTNPEVIVVATPDSTHADVLRKILACSPKIVLCEKPLTTQIEESRNLALLYRGAGVKLLVNYQRRFDSEVIKLKNKFVQGHTGGLISGVVYYSKGILHNGSHAIDLLRFIFGEPLWFMKSSSRSDYFIDDHTVAGLIGFQTGEIAMLGCDERAFSIFEVDLIFDNLRFRYSCSGTEVALYSVRPDPNFDGYYELLLDEVKQSGFCESMPAVISHIVQMARFCSNEESAISAENAVKTQEVCQRIADSPLHCRINFEKN